LVLLLILNEILINMKTFIKIKTNKAKLQNITNIGIALSCVFIGQIYFYYFKDIFYYSSRINYNMEVKKKKNRVKLVKR